MTATLHTIIHRTALQEMWRLPAASADSRGEEHLTLQSCGGKRLTFSRFFQENKGAEQNMR